MRWRWSASSGRSTPASPWWGIARTSSATCSGKHLRPAARRCCPDPPLSSSCRNSWGHDAGAMGLIRLLFEAPLLFLLLAVPLLYSVIAHEVAHGVCAKFFGDDTAQRAGRLTLNPLPHVDPMGLLMLFLAGFGWARPVPVSYANLRPARAG